MASAPSTRRSAEERRRELVEIAISHFAQHGYNGTSTDQIAREAGISQPYLFRLFGTKRELFLACHQAMHERIVDTFTRAAEGVPHTVQWAGSMFSVFFRGAPVTNYDEARDQDTAAYGRFFHSMLESGVHLPPSAFEAWFVSGSHDDEAVGQERRADLACGEVEPAELAFQVARGEDGRPQVVGVVDRPGPQHGHHQCCMSVKRE